MDLSEFDAIDCGKLQESQDVQGPQFLELLVSQTRFGFPQGSHGVTPQLPAREGSRPAELLIFFRQGAEG